MKDVLAFLQQSQSSELGQAAVWHRLEELYTKKLWHQLTLQVLDFVQDPCFAQRDGLIKLSENFISKFEHMVNPLSLVEIILHVIRQMTNPNVALTFLEKTHENVKSSDETVILCKTAIGALKLNIGDLQATKETTEDVKEMLNHLRGVTSVHSRFYDLSSKYYQTIGNLASYYKDALGFLGLVDIKDLPVSEQQERGFTLGLAGLLGGGVFNPGELLMHPVLESLRNTDEQWLFAFNSGDVDRFQTLKSAWGQQPDLAASEAQLLRKIQLLCLMEMTFTRPTNHRQLTFEEIAKSTKITVNKVELLVMKTFSGASKRQHRRGGQAGSHDVGAASSAGFAADQGDEVASGALVHRYEEHGDAGGTPGSGYPHLVPCRPRLTLQGYYSVTPKPSAEDLYSFGMEFGILLEWELFSL